MIVAQIPEGELLVTQQHDHARLSAEVLSLWRADGLPENPRRDDLLFAARHHDTGWREVDSAPHVDPETGRPRDFRSVPREERIDLWLRGTHRYVEERPYAALLITRHALEIHADRRGREEWEEGLLGPLDELHGELLAATGATPETVAADYRLLALADTLSLAVCARWREPVTEGGTRLAVTPGGPPSAPPVAAEVALDPFPLAGATTFEVACRTIPDRRYRGDAELGGTLAAARWQRQRVRVRPFAEGAAGAGRTP